MSVSHARHKTALALHCALAKAWPGDRVRFKKRLAPLGAPEGIYSTEKGTAQESWRGLGLLSPAGRRLKGTWQHFAETQRDAAKRKMVNHPPHPRGEATKSQLSFPQECEVSRQYKL